MATIKDIARIAGVSVTTVSKVLNDYPDISKQTKEMVKRVIARENYRPNAIARSLSSHKSHSIGIFFTDHRNSGLRHPFFRDIIYGIEKTLFQESYDLILFAHQWGDTFSYAEKCQSRQVDGAVLMGMPGNDPYLERLIDSEIPTVFIDLELSGKNSCYVISDNVEGAGQAVSYLAKLGHEQIGMIMGQKNTKPAQDRLSGFKQRIKELHLQYQSEWIVEADFSENGGYQAMNRILKLSGPYPTAIFCQGDQMAIGAMKAIEERGLAIPGDFSLIGFDDIEISSYVKPALTTIHQDKILMGEKAAQLLLKIINTGEQNYTPVVLPTKLKIRDSCRRLS